MTSVSLRPETRPTTAEIRAAVAAGNIPTLLAVLVEMTGDHRWMADRYRPTRSRGMDDNSSGGLGEDVQQEIRAAVVDALEDLDEVVADSAQDASAHPDPVSAESVQSS